MFNLRVYRSWNGMLYRCYNPEYRGYARYGGRGITVCDRWRNSFAEFTSDMGPHPGPGYTLDRINNDGDYEPGNCRWATHKQQSFNTRKTIYATFGGVRKPLAVWAEELGLKKDTVYQRLYRLGLTPDEALTYKRYDK